MDFLISSAVASRVAENAPMKALTAVKVVTGGDIGSSVGRFVGRSKVYVGVCA